MFGISFATGMGFIVAMIALLLLPGFTLVGVSFAYMLSGALRRRERKQTAEINV